MSIGEFACRYCSYILILLIYLLFNKLKTIWSFNLFEHLLIFKLNYFVILMLICFICLLANRFLWYAGHTENLLIMKLNYFIIVMLYLLHHYFLLCRYCSFILILSIFNEFKNIKTFTYFGIYCLFFFFIYSYIYIYIHIYPENVWWPNYRWSDKEHVYMKNTGNYRS